MPNYSNEIIYLSSRSIVVVNKLTYSIMKFDFCTQEDRVNIDGDLLDRLEKAHSASDFSYPTMYRMIFGKRC